MAAYYGDAYQWRIVPDSNRLQLPDYGASKFADANNFAVYDVDNDGREELLFCWPNDIVADRAAYILELQTGKFKKKSNPTPQICFFTTTVLFRRVGPIVKALPAKISGPTILMSMTRKRIPMKRPGL